MPSAELLRELLDYDPDTGVLKWRKRDIRYFRSLRACASWNGHHAGHSVGWVNANGYLATQINGVPYLVQRIIWTMMTGQQPPTQVDHIDGVRTNNRWKNFRGIETQVDSSKNRGLNNNNTSGFRGVQKRGNRYIVFFQRKYVGYFDTPEAASEVYERKAKEFRGEFYRLY